MTAVRSWHFALAYLVTALTAMNAFAAEDWKEARSVEGNFLIKFPSQPASHVEKTALEKTLEFHLSSAGGATHFQCLCTELVKENKADKRSVSRKVEDARDAMLASRKEQFANAAILRDTPIKWHGHYGRQFSITYDKESGQDVRVIVVDNRAYILTVSNMFYAGSVFPGISELVNLSVIASLHHSGTGRFRPKALKE